MDQSSRQETTDSHAGLSSSEAARRLAQYGPNTLSEKSSHPFLKFISYFWGPIPWMIEVAAILSAAVKHWEDFIIILVMLLINAGVGFWEEFKADNAIAALKKTLAFEARVLRDGVWRSLPAGELVPGDIIMVSLGNIIPADVRLIEGDYLSVDQSALTGESLPVSKGVGDEAYSSSIAKMGEMKAEVTATGTHTYFGRTAKLVESAGTTSHFQKAVLKIGNFLIFTTLGLVALILVVALFRHDPLVDTILFALILTVAAIPVALPAVLSVTMAVGAVNLSRMKAIVSRLVSLEEMAGMDVLCSDKTGTLTQNQLVVGEPFIVDAKDSDELLAVAALASNRDMETSPIDGAIFKAFGDLDQLKHFKTVSFEPFDPVRKRTGAMIESESGQFSAAKGAPQVILELTSVGQEIRQKINDQVQSLAKSGYRTLGVARKKDGETWKFLGLLPLFDPPREDSVETISQAKSMGIDIKMVTGDHIAIAKEIAHKLHLGSNIISAKQAFEGAHDQSEQADIDHADGYAEVYPEHKFKIVKRLQALGHIVGMTGDGVNDAPALKQADIGIAVSGATDAARAAAALVLTESGLFVIIRAIREARMIFERMTSYAIFRIAETIRVLLFMTLSILVFNFYPVTAVMIVLLAIMNDFPIMMIAYDNAPVAPNPVRWDMHRVLTMSIVLGVLGVISTFGLFWICEEYLNITRDVIQTIIFLKLLVAGHLTIYLTRNIGAFWSRPWPNWKLIVAAETTQVVGTLAAVYGWLVTPIGWKYALIVWGYALVWFLINNIAKVYVYNLLRHSGKQEARHLKRIETHLFPLS